MKLGGLSIAEINELWEAWTPTEPHVGGLWVCRRDASITLPYDDLILRTSEDTPYATPEVALLFKANRVREKDEADFQRVLPRMNRHNDHD